MALGAVTAGGERGLIGRIAARADRLGQAALVLFVLVGLALKLPADPGLAIAAAALALLSVALIGRLPARLILPCAVLGTAAVAVLGGGRAANVGWFAVCVFGAWCLVGAGGREGLAYWLGIQVLLGVEWLAAPDPGWGAWMAGMSFTMLSAAFVRHEIGLVAQLHAAQAGLAERSRAQERNRIARDLHDVIAHSLTVSLLHVASARLAVEHEPERAAQALDEAERLGRRSLDEVRSIVGLMGASGAGSSTAPEHGVAELGALVDGFRRAGADVALVLDGELGLLPATTGSVLYRILQEGLTNAAKHAAGEPVAVRVTAAEDHVELIVDSGGPGRAGRGDGQGVAGMRERAQALGGRCTAGARAGGWRVQAWLPRAAAARVGPE